MMQYLNEKLAENINSEDSSKSTPKKKKGRSELLEKSPVTPPDVLHDKERGKGAKKAKQKRVDKYDPVRKTTVYRLINF